MTKQLNLLATEIQSASDIEVVRQLRNATTDGFSQFTGQISPEQQQQWWKTTHVKGWLYWKVLNRTGVRVCVGFGVLRQTEDKTWWNSISVSPLHQGKKYGSYITHDLIHRHNEAIYAAVRWTNTAAINMHNVKDWERIEGPDKDLTYFKTRQ